MTALLLALTSALFYGAGDFVGGFVSRRAATMAVVATSQCAGLLLLAALMPLWPSALPRWSDLGLGALAGLAGGLSVALLYRALAVGTMALVAPVTAVCAVIVPVSVSVMFGERPSVRTGAGIALALVSVVLISQAPREDGGGRSSAPPRRPPRGLGLALLSGLFIGLFYILLARTGSGGGLWPLLVARVSSFALILAGAAMFRSPLLLPGRLAGWSVVAGVLDVAANALFLIASRVGPLSGVVTLTSLYPASTVLLARAVLRERLSRTQGIGVVCALVAVALIVDGVRS